jgi:heme-degrading monooxygenase HmoA
MAAISKTPRIVTVINVFFIDPGCQRWLVDALLDVSEKIMHKFPGFISLSVHRSTDGRRVVSYSQWRAREDFERMTQSIEARAFMESLSGIADSDVHVYEVVGTFEANLQPGADHANWIYADQHERRN